MKRVYCDECKNFIDMVMNDPNNLMSGIKENAKCKLGKRVMFRMPNYGTFEQQKSAKYFYNYDGGYVRYCDKFETK